MVRSVFKSLFSESKEYLFWFVRIGPEYRELKRTERSDLKFELFKIK